MKNSLIKNRKLVERRYSGRDNPVRTLSIPRKAIKSWKGQFLENVKVAVLEYTMPESGEEDEALRTFRKAGIRKGDCIGLLILPDYSPLLVDSEALLLSLDTTSDELSNLIIRNMSELAYRVVMPGTKRGYDKSVRKVMRYMAHLGYQIETRDKPEDFAADLFEDFESNIDLKRLPASTDELRERASKKGAAESRELQNLKLIQACKAADTKVIRQLLYKRVNLNDARDEAGRTILEMAIDDAKSYLVPLLLEGGADANSKDDNGYTPLHRAARLGLSEETIEALVKHGAEVNAKDKYGMTPLSIAVRNGDYNLAKLLIEKFHADVNSRDKSGKTVLDHLKGTQKGCGELMRMYEAQGAVGKASKKRAKAKAKRGSME